jgi:uncharacterized membrane protein
MMILKSTVPNSCCGNFQKTQLQKEAPSMNEKDLLIAILNEKKEMINNEDFIEMLIHEKISAKADEKKENLRAGDKMADALANLVGSWRFILLFSAVLFLWIFTNINLLKNPFDPYPFILLNLVLSCLAAIQAPIIMMSQNRQEAKDRLRAKNDYNVNLKSEFVVEDMYESLQKLIENQQKIFAQLSRLENNRP